MNTSQIRFAQPVNGRQQQIIANSSVVQPPTSAGAPSNTIVLRHPITHSNPNAVSLHGNPGVRGLVVSQPSNRPIAANITGSTGSNVQMYVAQQPVSILPRGGAVPSTGPQAGHLSHHNMGRGWNTPSATNTALGHQPRHHYPAASVYSGGTVGPVTSPSQMHQHHHMQQQRLHTHHMSHHLSSHQQQQLNMQHQTASTFPPPTSHGLRATAPSATMTVSSQPIPSVVNVQTAQVNPGTAMIRPKMEAIPTTSVALDGRMTQRSPTVVGSEDPQILQQVHKCHHFLSCLIRFSDSVEKRRNLTSIMQELIDAKISVLEFMDRVTDCLKSNTQLPQLRPFLEMVLPHLRREMYVGKLNFEGNELRAPPLSALQARPQNAQVPQQPQIATTATIPRHQHPTPMAQVIQPAPQPVQNLAPRQPGLAIHTSVNQQMPIQRPPAPGVTGPRAIAVAGGQNLRALHPRPAPIITTVTSTPTVHSSCGVKSVITHGPSPATISAAPQIKRITPRTQQASTTEDYEEYNDVAMMGGVNLTEESRNILPTVSAPAATTSRTCKEQMLVPISVLRNHMQRYTRGIPNISDDAVALLSHALEERLKNIFTHLSMAVEHRTTQYRECPLFEQDTDVRGQIKFLEEVDKAEKVRHDDEERAALIKAARSRSRNENTDHIKMKEKARLMMQKEYEMEKQREANITALAAIGSRKKRKLDTDFAQLSNETYSARNSGNSGFAPGGGAGGKSDGTPAKRIIRRATMKDLVYIMERDPNLKRSQLMWKASFK